MKSFLTFFLSVLALLGSSAHAQDTIEPTDDVYIPSDCATPPDTFFVEKGGDTALANKAYAIAYALGSKEWATLKKDENIDGASIREVRITADKSGYQLGVSFTESQLSFGSNGGTQNTPQTALLNVAVDENGKLGAVSAYFGRAYASPMFRHD